MAFTIGIFKKWGFCVVDFDCEDNVVHPEHQLINWP